MRTLLFIVAMLIASVAAAAGDGWQRYENPRFGFGLDIPPGFAAVPATTNTGDQLFNQIGGAEKLTVLGGAVQPGSFNQKWEATKAAYEADGWALSYDPQPPNWTSFTGVRDGQRLYVKMIPLCGGTKQFGMFALEYPEADSATAEPIALRLASSMTRSGTGFGC
jgi:hypothetical protein